MDAAAEVKRLAVTAAGESASSVVAPCTTVSLGDTAGSDRSGSGIVIAGVVVSGEILAPGDTDFDLRPPKADAAAMNDAGTAATAADSEPGAENAWVEFNGVTEC